VARKLYIAGTGTFAAEVLDWARASGAHVCGLIELRDESRVGSEIHGLAVVAPAQPPGAGVRAVIGSSGDRREIWSRLEAHGWVAGSVAHPSAQLPGSARIAAGAVIGPASVIGAGASIGAHVLINRGVLLGHHSTVGDFATLNPGVNVGGNADVGPDAYLGMGCVVVNGLTIGAGATVAAGAVAVCDVAAALRVAGVPAREMSAGR
jgi:acetyltransferase EpsM